MKRYDFLCRLVKADDGQPAATYEAVEAAAGMWVRWEDVAALLGAQPADPAPPSAHVPDVTVMRDSVARLEELASRADAPPIVGAKLAKLRGEIARAERAEVAAAADQAAQGSAPSAKVKP
jgi:hypothetical protein